MSSVQSEYASYPGGLSADLTPVIDYLSGILISPLDGTFVQAFQAAGASSPGEGLGRFRSVRMRLRALWKRRISSLRIVPGGRGRQSVIERPDCHAGLRCTGHRRPVRGPGAGLRPRCWRPANARGIQSGGVNCLAAVESFRGVRPVRGWMVRPAQPDASFERHSSRSEWSALRVRRLWPS